MRRLTMCLSASLVSFALAPAAYATVLHDESVSGDLPVVGFPNFNLVLGLNQVLGSWPATPIISTSNDRFDVTLPAGLQIDSIVVSYTPLVNGESINTALSFNPGNLFDDAFGQINGPSSQIVASFMDTAGGTTGPLDGTLANSTWGFELLVGTLFGTHNWTVDIQTSSNSPAVRDIPEPSSLALFAMGPLGLILLGAMRRRRKAA